MREFFKDDEGRYSMSRLQMFINGLIASYVTITVVSSSEPVTYALINLIFGLWLFTYLGKNAAKYIEKMKSDGTN